MIYSSSSSSLSCLYLLSGPSTIPAQMRMLGILNQRKATAYEAKKPPNDMLQYAVAHACTSPEPSLTIRPRPVSILSHIPCHATAAHTKSENEMIIQKMLSPRKARCFPLDAMAVCKETLSDSNITQVCAPNNIARIAKIPNVAAPRAESGPM